MYTGLQKIKGKQLQGFKLLHKNFDCAGRPDVDEILIQAYYHHFSSFLCIFNALEIADHQKKNEMQVLDVDGWGGGPTGNHSVAMQSLSDHGKSEAFMKIRAEITFLS